MRKPKLHNRIGRSVATLPICSLLALVLWWWPQGFYSLSYGVSLLLTALTAYVITETNNTYMLLRTRSRMISSVWLFGATCLGLLHPFQPAIVATFCLAASHYLLFHSYQQAEPVADTFHAFLLLALSSLFFAPTLYFAPFFLWYLLVFMRSLSLRSFFAALVGLLLPFWFWAGWLLWQGDLSPLVTWWTEIPLPYPFRIPWQEMADATATMFLLQDIQAGCPLLSLILLTVLSLWTGIAYLLHSYDDKIRTRMMLYVYAFQTVLVIAMALLLSGQVAVECFLPMLLLCASPLMAHYFTLHNTWVSLILFLLSVLSLSALAALSLFPHKLC